MRAVDVSRSLARLTAIDGAMVLGADLRLVGFGAKIETLDADGRQLALPICKQAPAWLPTHEARAAWPDLRDLELANLGTRHQSAARLCKSRPDATVFVVSQDRVVRSLRFIPGRGVLVRGPAYSSYGSSAPL